MITRQAIEQILSTINDPEIGLDIMNLGLIYDIQIQGDKAEVLMTLTTPYCPLDKYFAEHIPEKVKQELPELQDVSVRFTFDPPWTQEKIAPAARSALGMPSQGTS